MTMRIGAQLSRRTARAVKARKKPYTSVWQITSLGVTDSSVTGWQRWEGPEAV